MWLSELFQRRFVIFFSRKIKQALLSVPGTAKTFNNSVAFRDLFSLLCFNALQCSILDTTDKAILSSYIRKEDLNTQACMYDPPKGCHILYMNNYPISLLDTYRILHLLDLKATIGAKNCYRLNLRSLVIFHYMSSLYSPQVSVFTLFVNPLYIPGKTQWMLSSLLLW